MLLSLRDLGKYAGGGLISYITPRLLNKLGVPLDDWIVAMANLLSVSLSSEEALWFASLLVGVVLYFTPSGLMDYWRKFSTTVRLAGARVASYRLRRPWEKVAISSAALTSPANMPPVAPIFKPAPERTPVSREKIVHKPPSILLAEYASETDRTNLDRALYEAFDVINRLIDPVSTSSATVSNWELNFQKKGKEQFMAGMIAARENEAACHLALHEVIYIKYAYYCDELRDAIIEDGRRDIRGPLDALIAILRTVPESVALSELKLIVARDVSKLEAGIDRYREWRIAALERIKKKRAALQAPETTIRGQPTAT